MGIWVVVLEAVQGPDDGPDEIGPEDLDAFAEELDDYYPVVAGSPTSYEAELWVEENTAGGAMLTAQRIWQAAVREAGLPMWDVLRGEARDARALESGRLAWGSAPGEEGPPAEGEEPEPEPEPEPAPAAKARKKAATKKAVGKKAVAKKAVKKSTAKKKGARRAP
ncbi:MAG TPA: hypothetical protein VHH09_02390 [Acidimicrobiales bacterium]|nr:hypothetical protein [Acidimicrobiales bacterium]